MSPFLYPLLLLTAQPLDCGEARTQAEMNECAVRHFEAADAELNAVWPRALAYARGLDADGVPAFDDRPSAEARLREAQRAWLTFRDAHCAVAGYEARGGSMESMVYEGCRAQVTGERTEQLRSLIVE